jgi:hypothetical protein
MVQRTVAQMVGADSERKQADADNGRVASITLSHDTMKHITTLVTASIVAIVTLLKTVFTAGCVVIDPRTPYMHDRSNRP